MGTVWIFRIFLWNVLNVTWRFRNRLLLRSSWIQIVWVLCWLTKPWRITDAASTPDNLLMRATSASLKGGRKPSDKTKPNQVKKEARTIQKTSRKAKQAQRMTDVLQRSNGQNESEQNGAQSITNCSKNVNNAKHLLTAFRCAALFRLPHNSLYLFSFDFYNLTNPSFSAGRELVPWEIKCKYWAAGTAKITNHVREISRAF